MTYWFFCALLVSFSVESLAQRQASASKLIAFEDLPHLVRERNQNVQAADTSISAAKARTGFFSRSFLPHLGLKAGNESAKFGNDSTVERGFWRAEARINIYQGGKDRIEEKIREIQTESSQINASREYQSELREARKA